MFGGTVAQNCDLFEMIEVESQRSQESTDRDLMYQLLDLQQKREKELAADKSKLNLLWHLLKLQSNCGPSSTPPPPPPPPPPLQHMDVNNIVQSRIMEILRQKNTIQLSSASSQPQQTLDSILTENGGYFSPSVAPAVSRPSVRPEVQAPRSVETNCAQLEGLNNLLNYHIHSQRTAPVSRMHSSQNQAREELISNLLRSSPMPAAVAPKPQKFKGVRMRKWGKFVSEIRVSKSRSRVWLGSYSTPEEAAKAYDAATRILKGDNATGLNFPEYFDDVALSPDVIQSLINAIKEVKESGESPESDAVSVPPSHSGKRGRNADCVKQRPPKLVKMSEDHSPSSDVVSPMSTSPLVKGEPESSPSSNGAYFGGSHLQEIEQFQLP